MAPVQRRTRKQRRIQMLMLGGVMLAAATALVSFAFNDAIAFFRTPSELAEGGFDPSQRLRLGGLVADGSLVRGESETVRFSVVDGDGGEIEVTYTGILPDLFREGQGVVAEGYLRSGTFEAAEVLAKHDENYMPKEVADALKEQGHWKDEAAEPGS